MKQLYVLSTGSPCGGPIQLDAEATEALAASHNIVANGLCLDAITDLIAHKHQHYRPVGQDIERARLALDLAAKGKTTTLIASADMGVFAMTALVFELLSRAEQGLELCPEWLDVQIEVVGRSGYRGKKPQSVKH